MFAQQEPTDRISRAAAHPPINLCEVLATWLMLFHFQLGKAFSMTFGVFGCFQSLELLLSWTVFITVAHVDPICMKVHLPRSQLLRPSDLLSNEFLQVPMFQIMPEALNDHHHLQDMDCRISGPCPQKPLLWVVPPIP